MEHVTIERRERIADGMVRERVRDEIERGDRLLAIREHADRHGADALRLVLDAGGRAEQSDGQQ